MQINGCKVKSQASMVLLDAAGTMIHLKEPAGQHYATVAARHGLQVGADALQRGFLKAWKAMPERKPESGGRIDDDRPWWRTVATTALRESATIPQNFPMEDWFRDVYERFAEPGVWAVFDDVEPFLREVSKTHRLGVVSNFDGRLRRILADLGLAKYFEHIVISSEVGCEKPHKDIFLHAASLFGVSPGQCLHIGDDERRDLEGATSAGMNALLVDRPGFGLAEVYAKLAAEREEVIEPHEGSQHA